MLECVAAAGTEAALAGSEGRGAVGRWPRGPVRAVARDPGSHQDTVSSWTPVLGVGTDRVRTQARDPVVCGGGDRG